MTPPAVLVELTRRDHLHDRDVVESCHRGHLVVADGTGALVASLGESSTAAYLRSTVKPFQATASLEVLGTAAEDLSVEELAVGWASHTAGEQHLAAVRAILARAGIGEEALTCPPTVRTAAPGDGARRIHHNCSGKHALFAWAGQALGVPRGRRLEPDAPLQRRILAAIGDAVGPIQGVAVDGCGAPAVLAPLEGLARGFASLREDRRWVRITEAGLARPVLVGGPDRAESALLDAGVVAKPGAEGVFAAAWDGPTGPLAAACKIVDGASRAAATAIVALVAASGGPTVDWRHPVLGGGHEEGQCRASPAVVELGSTLARD